MSVWRLNERKVAEAPSEYLTDENGLNHSTGSCCQVATYMGILVDEGSRYGLEINWNKAVAINILNDGALTQPGAEPVKIVGQAVYLGGMVSSSTSAAPEVSRRLGVARGSFKSLNRCWSQANIPQQGKRQLYRACVVSKLMYGLESLWLLQRDLHRLDAFQAKCMTNLPHTIILYIKGTECNSSPGCP